jgi:hypothetical protein
MDQNPLPRGSLQVRDRLGEEVRTVPELPQPAVAVEAQYPAHPTGAMIVIKVLRIGRAADRAPTALGCEHLVELDLPDAVPLTDVSSRQAGGHAGGDGRRCGRARLTRRRPTVRPPGDPAEARHREDPLAPRTLLHIRFP